MALDKDTDQLPETECLAGSAPCELNSTELSPVLIVLTGNSAGRTFKLESSAVIGRVGKADLVLNDTGISRRHARVDIDEQGAAMLTDLGSKNGTFVGEQQVLSAALKPGDLVRLGPNVALKFELHDNLHEELLQRLYQHATRDPLTGILNKRSFEEAFTQLYQRAQAQARKLTLMVVDGDHFKSINDNYGHAAGDQVLKELAARLGRHLRKQDLLARFGGEEFVIVGVDIGEDEGVRLAERVRQEVSRELFDIDHEEGRKALFFSVSIGVCGRLESSRQQMFEAADQALYKAKEGGRNLVVASG